MIVALEGILESRGIDSVIIKVGSISFQVFVPSSILGQLGTVGDEVHLHTHLYLREDNVALYGFGSAEESRLFQNLISVSGIGPKVGLGLLSTLGAEQLASAIVSGNVDLLSQAPGLGKKTAGRIVLDLKSKLESEWGVLAAPVLVQQDADVVAALTNLGYSLKEATHAVSSFPDSRELDLEERIRLALKQLAAM